MSETLFAQFMKYQNRGLHVNLDNFIHISPDEAKAIIDKAKKEFPSDDEIRFNRYKAIEWKKKWLVVKK